MAFPGVPWCARLGVSSIVASVELCATLEMVGEEFDPGLFEMV